MRNVKFLFSKPVGAFVLEQRHSHALNFIFPKDCIIVIVQLQKYSRRTKTLRKSVDYKYFDVVGLFQGEPSPRK